MKHPLLKFGGGIALVLYALLGAIGFGVTGLVISGGLYLLGFIGIGLAKPLFVGIVAVGALFAVVIGVIHLFVLSSFQS